MKKFLLSLCAVLSASFAFAGDGTKENPYSVADILAATLTDPAETAWVKAYIVGNAPSSMENAIFKADGASATNLVLADAQDETTYTNCIPLQLPKGDIRTALNLQDNPGNLGKELLVYAQITKYFSQNGLKSPTDFELSGEGGGGGGGSETTDFEAALTDNQGAWTFEDILLPEGASYVWMQTSSYGMKASARVNGTDYASESYLVSPVITLGEGSVLTFDHVQRFSSDAATQLTLWIRAEGATEWATQLTIPTFSDGSNWSFLSSGDIDLSAYAGQNIQLGYRYTSTAESCPTWEIKNVKITNAKAAEDAPELTDPTNTPETAYTIAQAIEIIQNRATYDMSKEVYTKGVIKSIKSLDVSQYPRAQYYIGDETTEDQIQVYNGYYIGGADFTANDQIKEGDEVIVCGKLTLYGATYEIDANNYIYSLNGKTTIDDNPDPVVTPLSTIAEVQAAEPGKVKIEGTIVATCTAGAVIGHATGYIYLYDKEFTSQVGDQVTIEGTTSTYGGFRQFSASKGYELTKTGTTEVTHPTPVALDGAAMDAWIAEPVIEYAQYTGTLTISGNYYNVSVEGATTAQGSLMNLPDALKEGIADGDVVNVTGYVMYVTSSKYVNTVVTEIGKDTGVSQVEADTAQGAIYDLSGRRVVKPAKGIYIINRKAVLVK